MRLINASLYSVHHFEEWRIAYSLAVIIFISTELEL